MRTTAADGSVNVRINCRPVDSTGSGGCTAATAGATAVVLIHGVRGCSIRICGVRRGLHLTGSVRWLCLRHNTVLRLALYWLANVHASPNADADTDHVLPPGRCCSTTSVLTHRIPTRVLVSTATSTASTAGAASATILTRLTRLCARVSVGDLAVIAVEVVLIPGGILTRTLTDHRSGRVLITVRRGAVLTSLPASVDRLSLRLARQVCLRRWRLRVLIHHHRRRWYRRVKVHHHWRTRWHRARHRRLRRWDRRSTTARHLSRSRP